MGKVLRQYGRKTEEGRTTLSRISLFEGTDLLLALSFQIVPLHSSLKIAASLGQFLHNEG